MDKAKDTVKQFMSKDGRHDTSVHESVAPAVTHENITRQQHENVMPVVDREVHQDHHHTSVQPIHDTHTLQEQHHHKAIPVEHRSFEHDDHDGVKSGLAQERAQFADKQTRVEGERTKQEVPVVTGEHRHHHVHETIQPVVQRETVEPHVHHTVVPVHETHHNPTQHHSSSALPPVSMSDFKQQGGALTGREARSDHFQGEPRNFGGGNHPLGSDRGQTGREEFQDGVKGEPRTLGGALGNPADDGQKDTRGLGREHEGYRDDGLNRGQAGQGGQGNFGHTDAGNRQNNPLTSDPLNRNLDRDRNNDPLNRSGNDGLNRDRDGYGGQGVGQQGIGQQSGGRPGTKDELPDKWQSGTQGFNTNEGSNIPGSGTTGTRTGGSNLPGSNTTGSNTGSSNLPGSGTTHSSGAYGSSQAPQKASLLDKLNPSKDTTGDGKAGFMK